MDQWPLAAERATVSQSASIPNATPNTHDTMRTPLDRIFSTLTGQADNALYKIEHTEDAEHDPRTGILRDFVARMKAANQTAG